MIIRMTMEPYVHGLTRERDTFPPERLGISMVVDQLELEALRSREPDLDRQILKMRMDEMCNELLEELYGDQQPG